jgi:hypothetical protein
MFWQPMRSIEVEKINKSSMNYLTMLFILFHFLKVMSVEDDPINLLPESNKLGPNVTAEYQQKAQGEKLVELINGGAVLFFKHGFRQTVFQEYYVDSTQYINLEIYQMETNEGAQGIFMARFDTSAQQIDLGEQGFKSNYYCAFYRSNYYVIITASAATEELQNIFLNAAAIIDKKIMNN